MKTLFALLCLLSVSFAGTCQSRKPMKLMWSDEFNYEGLPDSTKWGYEEGMSRNVQKQYYTKNRLENASVHNGILTITARKEDFANPQYNGFRKKLETQYPAKYLGMQADSIPAYIRVRYDKVIHYTSASLTTYGKVSWKYGRIDIKAMVPQGPGLSCALWMLGINKTQVSWPKCGEIDIMESIGRNPNQIHGTIHFADPVTGKPAQDTRAKTVSDAPGTYHVYSMEWDETNIKFYVDDILYNTAPVSKAGNGDDNPFKKKFYLIMNIAIGSGGWAGPLDDSVLPQQLKIDYVRYYQ